MGGVDTNITPCNSILSVLDHLSSLSSGVMYTKTWKTPPGWILELITVCDVHEDLENPSWLDPGAHYRV